MSQLRSCALKKMFRIHQHASGPKNTIQETLQGSLKRLTSKASTRQLDPPVSIFAASARQAAFLPGTSALLDGDNFVLSTLDVASPASGLIARQPRPVFFRFTLYRGFEGLRARARSNLSSRSQFGRFEVRLAGFGIERAICRNASSWALSRATRPARSSFEAIHSIAWLHRTSSSSGVLPRLGFSLGRLQLGASAQFHP
jgi:hypothetical protein